MIKRLSVAFLLFAFLILPTSVQAQASYLAPQNFYLGDGTSSGCEISGDAGSITLYWNAVEDATSYKPDIYRPGDPAPQFSTPTSSLSYTIFLRDSNGNPLYGTWQFRVQVHHGAEDFGEFTQFCTYNRVQNQQSSSSQQSVSSSSSSLVNTTQEATSTSTETSSESSSESSSSEDSSSTTSSEEESDEKNNLTWVISAVCCGLLLLVIAAVVLVYMQKRKKKEEDEKHVSGDKPASPNPRKDVNKNSIR